LNQPFFLPPLSGEKNIRMYYTRPAARAHVRDYYLLYSFFSSGNQTAISGNQTAGSRFSISKYTCRNGISAILNLILQYFRKIIFS